MNRTDQTHSFDTGVACVTGTDQAVLLKEISGWCENNERRAINLHDGYHWTFNPASAYAEKFDYMNIKSVSRWLKKMAEQHIVYVGNYNKRRADRTLWHRVNPVFYRLASSRYIVSLEQWSVCWDQESETFDASLWSPQNEVTKSQNEVTKSQNEVTKSQNEVTLPSLTPTLNTPSTTSNDNVDEVDDAPVTLFDVNETAEQKKKVPAKKKSQADFRADADQVIDELNLYAGRKYATGTTRGAEANRKKVTSLLRKGYPVDEITDMIMFKVYQWKGGKMEQYLQPSTLFGGKAEQYIQEAGQAKTDPSFAAKVQEWKAADLKETGGIVLTSKTADVLQDLANEW